MNVLAGFTPFERRLISQRIRQALALKRAQGVRLGRPRTMSQYAIERIGASAKSITLHAFTSWRYRQHRHPANEAPQTRMARAKDGNRGDRDTANAELDR